MPDVPDTTDESGTEIEIPIASGANTPARQRPPLNAIKGINYPVIMDRASVLVLLPSDPEVLNAHLIKRANDLKEAGVTHFVFAIDGYTRQWDLDELIQVSAEMRRVGITPVMVRAGYYINPYQARTFGAEIEHSRVQAEGLLEGVARGITESLPDAKVVVVSRDQYRGRKVSEALNGFGIASASIDTVVDRGAGPLSWALTRGAADNPELAGEYTFIPSPGDTYYTEADAAVFLGPSESLLAERETRRLPTFEPSMRREGDSYVLIYDDEAFTAEDLKVVKETHPPRKSFVHPDPRTGNPWHVNMAILGAKEIDGVLEDLQLMIKPQWRLVAISRPDGFVSTAIPSGIYNFQLPLAEDRRYGIYQEHAKLLRMDPFDIDLESFLEIMRPRINEMFTNTAALTEGSPSLDAGTIQK